MSENLSNWNKFSSPPDYALKKIEAGRLKGKSDINPQWRYKAMTEVYGPIGEGWKYGIEKLWTEAAGQEMFAFALVTVSVKTSEGWSDPIPGIGGSMLIEQESRGLHANDEGFKMAVTDALSVALKMLGVGADVYMGMLDSKYNKPKAEESPVASSTAPASPPSNNVAAFIPEVVNSKAGTKADGTSYTKFGIKDASGNWYGTFSETFGEIAKKAHVECNKVKVSYKQTKFGRDVITLELDGEGA